MDPKFVAGVIYFSTRRKSPVAGPSGEPCKQELALTNEMELFVFTWANQSFVCYVTFFISCSPRDLPARHATLKNSCKTKTTIDFLACYFDL